MSHVYLGVSCCKRGRDSDSEVLVRWEVGFVVHGDKPPVVNDGSHDIAGRLASFTGAGDKANCDGHFFRASQGVLEFDK